MSAARAVLRLYNSASSLFRELLKGGFNKALKLIRKDFQSARDNRALKQDLADTFSRKFYCIEL